MGNEINFYTKFLGSLFYIHGDVFTLDNVTFKTCINSSMVVRHGLPP